jgi:hypothetical protein
VYVRFNKTADFIQSGHRLFYVGVIK